MHHSGLFGNSAAHSIDVHIIAFHRNFFIDDSYVCQRSRYLHRMAYDCLHSVIGRACGTDYFVTGMQVTQHGNSQGMGSGYKLRTYQGCFGSKNIRINRVQFFPA